MIDVKEKYTIFYKPHPLFPVIKDSDFEKYLLNSNINILPAKMPLEVILWQNKNLYITGFSSSINSLVEPKRTISFFGDRIGFSKLLDAEGIFKAKIYQIEISQEIATGLIKDYVNSNSAIDNLTRKNEELLHNINTIKDEIENLKNEIIKINNISFELSKIERKIKILYYPLKPLIYIKNKIFKK